MDLHAEYARCYGGPPRPRQPWHEVLAMARRVHRFDTRERLIVADGTKLGQPTTDSSAIPQMQMNHLRRIAGEGK